MTLLPYFILGCCTGVHRTSGLFYLSCSKLSVKRLQKYKSRKWESGCVSFAIPVLEPGTSYVQLSFQRVQLKRKLNRNLLQDSQSCPKPKMNLRRAS